MFLAMCPIYFASVPLQEPAHSAYAELQIMTEETSIPLNETQNALEVKLSSKDSAISPLTVMLSINDGSENSRLLIQELKAYDSRSNTYFISPDGQFPQENGSAVILDSEFLPSGLPAGGGLGIVTEIWNGGNARLDITMVFVAEPNASTSIEVRNPPELPFDVIQNHHTKDISGNSTSQEINVDDSFVDPEIHCETCTKIEYRPNGSSTVEVAYVTNATDLGLATTLTWWAMGDGEVTFLVVGRQGMNDTISYAKEVAVMLNDEWQQFEVELDGIPLHNVTEPFGFSIAGVEEKTLYLKGVTFD
jgi:hypothetical protein